MLKALPSCLMLLAIAIGGTADVQPAASCTQSAEQHDARLSGSDDREVLAGAAEVSRLAGLSGQALLTAIETWVSNQFNLPIQEHPSIEFVPPAQITSLRGCCPIQGRKLRRMIEPRLLNTTLWPSTTTPREPSICPRAGPVARLPSCRCLSTRWFIIFNMCLGSNSSAPRSARCLLIWRRTAGSACLDIAWKVTLILIHFLSW
jgi:hypothetical protein